MQPKVERLEACLEAFNFQVSESQAAVFSAKPVPDESRALFDAEMPSHPNLHGISAEAWRRIDGHSPLLFWTQELFHNDANWAFPDQLRLLIDTMHNRTVAFCSASIAQIDMHGQTFC